MGNRAKFGSSNRTPTDKWRGFTHWVLRLTYRSDQNNLVAKGLKNLSTPQENEYGVMVKTYKMWKSPIVCHKLQHEITKVLLVLGVDAFPDARASFGPQTKETLLRNKVDLQVVSWNEMWICWPCFSIIITYLIIRMFDWIVIEA